MRLTRSRAISGSHSTSAKWQPYECSEYCFAFGSSNDGAVLPVAVIPLRLAIFSTSSKGTPLAVSCPPERIETPTTFGCWSFFCMTLPLEMARLLGFMP